MAFTAPTDAPPATILTLSRANRSHGVSGMSPYTPGDADTAEAFRQHLYRYGHVIVTDSLRVRPINHRVAGVGGGHDDATWAECRFQAGSRVAWEENDPEAFR